MRIAIQKRYLTLNKIVVEVNFFCNASVSSRTVCPRLCKCGLCNCKPVQGPILAMEHQQ